MYMLTNNTIGRLLMKENCDIIYSILNEDEANDGK